MNRTVFKNRQINFNPPYYSFFKGYKSNPSETKEQVKITFRPPGYDFVVDWQMNDKAFNEIARK
jgi:hypothetical protein